MSSPISPVIADLVMEEIEEIAIVTAPHSPKWFFHYVDDSHTCLKEAQKSFQLHAHVTCSRHARLCTPNDFLVKVKCAQLTGNENAA